MKWWNGGGTWPTYPTGAPFPHRLLRITPEEDYATGKLFLTTWRVGSLEERHGSTME